MPELELQLTQTTKELLTTGLLKQTRELGAIWTRLVAVIAFPGDAAQRREFLNSWTMAQVNKDDLSEALEPFAFIDGVLEFAEQQIISAIAEDFWDDEFSINQLARSNTDRLETKATAGLRDATLAGRQLWSLYDLQHPHSKVTDEPSLAKVQWLISEMVGSNGPSADRLQKAWRAASSVSHLIAGLEYCRAWLVPRPIGDVQFEADDFEGRLIGYWLAASRAFQEFLLTWDKPRSRPETAKLISYDDIWSIPESLRLPDIGPLTPRTFGDSHKSIIQSFERRPR